MSIFVFILHIMLFLMMSDVKSYHQYLLTALHIAALGGHIEVVRLLMDRHANIEAVGQVSQNVSIASTYCCITLYFVLHSFLI